MKRLVYGSVLATALLAIVCGSAFAQTARDRNSSLTCREGSWYNDRLVSFCQIREQTLAPAGQLAIDGRQNGGISVKGWDQNQILVRARVQAGAISSPEAESLAAQVRIETGGNKIFASGPENQRNAHWDVSYEVFVPRRSDVSLETHNGGIAIQDVNGRIDFTALNGGVVLRRVAGTVKGSTTNGGLVVDLTGDRWEGDSLDVSTTNGGIVMSVPENYSANIQTGTVNGSINVDFPVTVQGRITKQLSFNLGSGGASVRATTTNGGVRIQKVSGRE
jgi:DUF4097 and DUF4098 domain-containing protein YvlB